MTSTCHIHADTDSVANAGRTKVESPLSVPVYDPPAKNWSGASGSVANTRRTRLG